MLVHEPETACKTNVHGKSTGDAQTFEVTLCGKTYTIPKSPWWQSDEQIAADQRRREARAARKRELGGSCPKELRRRVLKAFQCTCQYCGKQDDPASPFLHVDRIIPGSQGGRYVPENVTLACINCNCNRSGVIAPVYGPVRPLSAMEGTSS